jgi:hypothetical protein
MYSMYDADGAPIGFSSDQLGNTILVRLELWDLDSI